MANEHRAIGGTNYVLPYQAQILWETIRSFGWDFVSIENREMCRHSCPAKLNYPFLIDQQPDFPLAMNWLGFVNLDEVVQYVTVYVRRREEAQEWAKRWNEPIPSWAISR